MGIDRVNQHVIREYTTRVQPTSTQGVSHAGAPRADEATAHPTRRPDEVSLSAGSRELEQLREAVKAAPDVREDRVAAIRRQLAEGTYEIDYHALAKKLAGVINFE